MNRYVYPFIHEYGLTSFGLTKGEWARTIALTGVLRSRPIGDTEAVINEALDCAQELIWGMQRRSQDYFWELRYAFPVELSDGIHGYSLPGLTAFEWLASHVFAGLLGSPAGFEQKTVNTALVYADILSKWLGVKPATPALPYRQISGLSPQARREVSILAELIPNLPPDYDYETGAIKAAVALARALGDQLNHTYRGNTKKDWLIERLSPLMASRGAALDELATRLLRYAEAFVAEFTRFNPHESALPVVRYKETEDGDHLPSYIAWGLSTQEWLLGHTLAGVVRSLPGVDDAIEGAASKTDAIIAALGADPDVPAFPMQVIKGHGITVTHTNHCGVTLELWLSGLIAAHCSAETAPEAIVNLAKGFATAITKLERHPDL